MSEQSLKQQVKEYAISFLKRKPTEEREPSNVALYLVMFAAFCLLAILDLITAVVVGGMTNWLYGVLTFGVGIGPTVVNEAAFFRPFSSKNQRNMAIVGIVSGILATLLIGVMAGVVSAANYFNLINISPFKIAIEITMLVSLVVISGWHVTIWMIYIFIDEGVKSKQKHAQNKAESAQRQADLHMAEEDMEMAITTGNRLANLVDEGKGQIVQEAFKNITGKTLIPEDTNNRPY